GIVQLLELGQGVSQQPERILSRPPVRLSCRQLFGEHKGQVVCRIGDAVPIVECPRNQQRFLIVLVSGAVAPLPICEAARSQVCLRDDCRLVLAARQQPFQPTPSDGQEAPLLPEPPHGGGR